jgi:3-oxoacyl-[acyl-carrier protein] reductase
MDLGIEGRVAIVAASSRGLGRAIAIELAREGAEVAICSRSAADLEKAAEEIRRATGREALRQALDVSRGEDVERFVDAVEKRFGRVDICVTNAGGPPSKPFAEISLDDWRGATDSLLLGTVHFAHAVLPRMKARGWGRLVTITSVTVKQPLDNMALSNSVRAAVAALARTLANEYGQYGITVNNVCPGYTLTDRLKELAGMMAGRVDMTPEQVFERWSSEVPARRLGKPEEFAAVVAFLASERAAYVNGVSVAVDGGWVKSLL